MSPNALLSRNPETIATEIDGEVVLMSLVTGRTFGLDKRASRIWSLLEQPRTIEAIVTELLKVYDTTPEKCLAGVITFASNLSEAQLASVADATESK